MIFEENFPVAQHYQLSAYSEARCLDGSPGAYYFRPGSGDGSKKVFFFLEGGGFCQSESDCAERAKSSYFGSTKGDDAQRTMREPYFSTSAEDNPLLYNWNFVFMRYCDGGYFGGNVGTVVSYGSSKLYFRGLRILEAGISETKQRLTPTDVIVGGCSSGGIATLAQLDAIRRMFTTNMSAVQVSGFVDSGFYMDTPIFTPLKKFVTESQRAVELLSPDCLKAEASEPWRCFVAEVNAKHLITSTFSWQSRFDDDHRDCEISAECAKSMDCVNSYGRNVSVAIRKHLLSPWTRGHAAFIDACNRHCWNGPATWMAAYKGRNFTVLQAHHLWYTQSESRSLVWEQEGSFPNESCDNLVSVSGGWSNIATWLAISSSLAAVIALFVYMTWRCKGFRFRSIQPGRRIMSFRGPVELSMVEQQRQLIGDSANVPEVEDEEAHEAQAGLGISTLIAETQKVQNEDDSVLTPTVTVTGGGSFSREASPRKESFRGSSFADILNERREITDTEGLTYEAGGKQNQKNKEGV